MPDSCHFYHFPAKNATANLQRCLAGALQIVSVVFSYGGAVLPALTFFRAWPGALAIIRSTFLVAARALLYLTFKRRFNLYNFCSYFRRFLCWSREPEPEPCLWLKIAPVKKNGKVMRINGINRIQVRRPSCYQKT